MFVLCLVRPVVFAAVVWLLEPCGWDCPAVFRASVCVVVPCGCRVFVSLLVWRCGFYYSLAVPPSFWNICMCIIFSTEPFGLCVTGACWEPWAGGSWLGCRLGRPVGCSSTLGIWLQLQPPGTFPPLATWALITKKLSSRCSNQVGKIILTACQFAWCPALKKPEDNYSQWSWQLQTDQSDVLGFQVV